MRSLTAPASALAALTIVFHPAAPAPASPPEPGIVRIADLETARAAHTTTELPSGLLLVAGGMGGGGNGIDMAELIDVTGARVAARIRMTAARIGHTATALGDGGVVLAGGQDGQYLASVEVFDPARRRFLPSGRLREARSGHTATLLRDGRILIAGGVGEGWTFLASAELFDPRTGESELVGPLSVPRESHTATLLEDGRVLVIGGHRGRREAMEVYASAELYDPATRRFGPAGTLGIPRHKHDAVRLADGRVLVIGGADRTDRRFFETTEFYSPSERRFRPGPRMASSRYKIAGTSVLLPNGDVLVPAGARQAELLEAGSLRFRAIPGEFPDAFHFATATPHSSGAVFVVGGYARGNRTTGGVWRFQR